MEKKTRDKLLSIKKNPQTGVKAHENSIIVGVETAFLLDSLIEEIRELRKETRISSEQSSALAVTNNRLQFAVLILTALAVGVTAGEYIPRILELFSSISFDGNLRWVSVVISVATASLAFVIERQYLQKKNKEYSQQLSDYTQRMKEVNKLFQDSSKK